MRQAATFDQLR